MPINVRDKVKFQASVRHCIQRGQHHLRPQVAATNANVDHGGDATCRGVAHGFNIGQHGVQHTMHIVAVWPQATRCAQCRVQNRPVFRRVDGFAREHVVAQGLHPTLPRQVVQETLCGDIEVVLGQVGEHLGGLQAETLKTLGVLGKGFTQVKVLAVGLIVAL